MAAVAEDSYMEVVMSTVSVSSIRNHARPFRRIFVGVETLVAIGGVSGTWQLWTGTYAPPISDLEALGLDSWRLPAVWLFSSVAVPSTVAAIAAFRAWHRTPAVVLVASGLLLTEVLVQIPFVGPSALQAVFGGIAVAMGALAVTAQASGGWRGDANQRTIEYSERV